MTSYDVAVIGGGTAGLVSAAMAAGLGARTLLVERERLGGECLWTGCVPSKALLAAARAAHEARTGQRFGVVAERVTVDFAAVMAHVRDAQRRIEPHDSPDRFRTLGVEVVSGEARLQGAGALRIDGRTVRARHIVLATGSRPAVPPIPGLADVPFHTNETIFDIARLPAHLLVVGGGAIGLELAQAFVRLGSRVTVLEQSPALLPHEDEEVVALLAARLAAEGVALRTGTRVASAERMGDGIRLMLDAGDGATSAIDGDVLLVATGRSPRVEDLGLESAGVAHDRDGLRTDARLRTTVPGIWGAGDVVGPLRFTHVAEYQARTAVRNALFPFSAKVDYRVVPWAYFTDPELAHVGLTEREARERHGADVRVWRQPLDDVDRAIADGRTDGLVKLVTTRRGHILGAHLLGYGAGNMIGEITLAMRQGVRLGELTLMIRPYPSYPDAIKGAGLGWFRGALGPTMRRVVRRIVARAR